MLYTYLKENNVECAKKTHDYEITPEMKYLYDNSIYDKFYTLLNFNNQHERLQISEFYHLFCKLIYDPQMQVSLPERLSKKVNNDGK